MNNLAYILRNIVGGNNHICCLCLSICNGDDLLSFENEAICPENTDKILLSGLIKTVLGIEFLNYVEIMMYMCKTCVIRLESCYRFINTCNSNTAIISKMLMGLCSPEEASFLNIMKPEDTSLYISINLENFSSQLLFDSKKIHSDKQALEQYKSLIAPQKKLDKENIKLENIQCSECDKEFKTESNLQNHFTKIHTGFKYKCTKCPKSFKSKAKIKAHDINSHIIMTCDECGKTYNNRKAWHAHKTCHKSSFVCTKCGRTYKNKATFKNHINLNICSQRNRHSPTDAKYTCDYCKKKYTQKVSLKVHIQFEHGNYKGHICEWCGKKFWAQSRLKAHIVTHTKEKNFTCSICNKNFVTKESLLYHTRLHTGEKPYKCSECSSTFLSASRRSDHIKRHHIGAKSDLQCDKCFGKFKTHSGLLKHQKTHEDTLLGKSNLI